MEVGGVGQVQWLAVCCGCSDQIQYSVTCNHIHRYHYIDGYVLCVLFMHILQSDWRLLKVRPCTKAL